MTEHPNYKYRPRRRKHNKQRATPSASPRAPQPLSSPGMSPRYSSYVPNAAGLSPSPGQFTSGLDYPTNSTNEFSEVKRQNYSPVNFQQQGKNLNQYQNYQYYQGYQKSPYNILHTPESSPTQSPEPKITLKTPKSPSNNQEIKESTDENTPVLPTPEMSPLEQDKDNFQFQEEKNRLLQQGTSNCTSVTSSQNFARQNFRPTNYTNSQPITSMPMANGVYVMCANRSSVEQGHVVTGTFFPPVATSQDHQLLGVTPNITSTTAPSNNTMSYYNTPLTPQYYPQKDFYKGEDQIMSEQIQEKTQENYMDTFKTNILEKDNYDLYKTSLTDTYNYNTSPLVPSFIQPDERSDVDSDVDAREFDKYLKFTNNTDQSLIDSNHNYHRNDSISYTYPQHQSVILQNTNIKAEPSMMTHYVTGVTHDVYGDVTSQIAPVAKSDDDFSEILAGVRKTCYSN